MTNQDLRKRIKKILRRLWLILKIILLLILIIICIEGFRPLSEEELEDEARSELGWALFDMGKIDPALFESDPVIKYEDGKKWYEWVYRSGSDTLAIGVTVSKCPLKNIYPEGYYVHDNADLAEKLEYTDPDVIRQ